MLCVSKNSYLLWRWRIEKQVLPSLHSGPPNVVMLQSQLKPSHCWRHTPWLAHESSWHVVLGPARGDNQWNEVSTLTPLRGSWVCSSTHIKHTDNRLLQTEDKHIYYAKTTSSHVLYSFSKHYEKLQISRWLIACLWILSEFCIYRYLTITTKTSHM